MHIEAKLQAYCHQNRSEAADFFQQQAFKRMGNSDLYQCAVFLPSCLRLHFPLWMDDCVAQMKVCVTPDIERCHQQGEFSHLTGEVSRAIWHLHRAAIAAHQESAETALSTAACVSQDVRL